MPATSDKQAHAMQMALALKKGHKLSVKNPAISRIAQTMSAAKIREFTTRTSK